MNWPRVTMTARRKELWVTTDSCVTTEYSPMSNGAYLIEIGTPYAEEAPTTSKTRAPVRWQIHKINCPDWGRKELRCDGGVRRLGSGLANERWLLIGEKLCRFRTMELEASSQEETLARQMKLYLQQTPNFRAVSESSCPLVGRIGCCETFE